MSYVTAAVGFAGRGAVLVMKGACQEQMQHCVPKRAGVPGPRINLTFRTIVERER